MKNNFIQLPTLPNFRKESMTLGKFLSEWIQKIDVYPVGQRLDTDGDDNEKKEGIISSVLANINFGEITICVTPNNNAGYKFESIDGGHRVRYTRDFHAGNSLTRFQVMGKYFSELSEEEQTRFNNYPITLVIYEPIDVFTKGYIFRTLNKTTDVNDQEMRNSYGDIDVANLIRETTRIVMGIKNKPHQLFDATYLIFDNYRLKTDEMVARLTHRIAINNLKDSTQKTKEYLGESSHEQLNDMYYHSELFDIQKTKKELNEVLDFLLSMASDHKRIYNRGLSQRDFRLLSFVWFYMKDTYKVWSIPNDEDFIKAFKKAFNRLINPNGRYGKILNKQDFDKKGRTIAEAFVGYLGAPHNKNKILQLMKWLLSEFPIEEFIVVKDTKRVYNQIEKERKLIEQNYKCFITGKKVTMKDCEASHIVSHANGGKSTYDNFVMVLKEHNRAMGSTNLNDYKTAIGL